MIYADHFDMDYLEYEQKKKELENRIAFALQAGKYEDAITDLQKIVDEEEDFQDGSAAYYLAQSYRKNGDLDSAKPYYQYVIDKHPGTERARTSQNYVDAQAE